MHDSRTRYEKYVQDKSTYEYLRGLISRFLSHLKYEYYSYRARRNGAQIGKGVIMCKEFMKACNKNTKVGDHCVINSGKFIGMGLFPVEIGCNVIIGDDVRIILGGHALDSTEWEPYRESSKLIIEDFVWLCPNSCVMQGVKKIGRGSVIGACSVLYHSTKPMSIVAGNPGNVVGTRECVHSDLIVESLLHGDFLQYKETRRREIVENYK